MTNRIAFTLVLICIVVITAFSQPSRSLRITVKDGSGVTRILTIGVDPKGTYDFDPMFGELPLPPPPPDWLFDARLLDPHGWKRYKHEGSASDIRAFGSNKQIDTFYVRIQTSQWPVTLTWDSSVRSWCDSLTVRNASVPFLIASVGAQQRVTLTGEKETSFLMVLHGPRIVSH